MKKFLVFAALLLLTTPLLAAKACETMKSEIDAKLQAKGVKNYTLTIVPNDQVKEGKTEGKVVGSCDGGTKKIVYKRK